MTASALVGGAALAVAVSQHIAHEDAVRDARDRTVRIANAVAAPLVNDDVRHHDPRAVRHLDTALRHRVREGTVSHLALWDIDGDVIWTDDVDATRSGDGPPAELRTPPAAGSDPAAAADAGDGSSAYVAPGSEELVEVYVRTVDADGRPFILEAYTPRSSAGTDAGALTSTLLLLTVGSLLALAVAIAPLHLSLARRIDRADASRHEILHRALLSWRRERERLAQALHDDLVQDLSAMAYALPAVLAALPQDSRGRSARATGERMSDLLVRSVASLRLVLTDLSPSGMEGAGLAAALSALAEEPREHGVRVVLRLDPDLRTEEATGTLVYRVVREGLRNVVKHAAATEVTVTVGLRDSVVEVTVDDDGRGPVGSGDPDGHVGHVGLLLLERTLADVGGSLALLARPEGGARLRAAIPVRAVPHDQALDG